MRSCQVIRRQYPSLTVIGDDDFLLVILPIKMAILLKAGLDKSGYPLPTHHLLRLPDGMIIPLSQSHLHLPYTQEVITDPSQDKDPRGKGFYC